MSDSDKEEEENGNDIDEVAEQEDIVSESSDLESNNGMNIDNDDIEEEDDRGDTVLEEEDCEDDVVKEEDGEEDNEENEEEEEMKKSDEEEEEEEEVVEEDVQDEGKPQYKTILGKPQNPNLLTIIAHRNRGFPTVRFVAKDGCPLEFDMTNKRDRETVRGLIHSPMKGSVWRVLRKEQVKSKEIQKQKKQDVVMHLALQHHLMTKRSRQRSAQPKMRQGSKVVGKKRQRKPMLRRLR